MPAFLKLTFFSFFLMCGSIAKAAPKASDIPYDKHHAFSRTEKESGKLISRAESPATYQLLEAIVRRLEKGQIEIEPKLKSVSNLIWWVDDPSINAQVYSVIDWGNKEKRNLIFLNKGLIEHLWEQAKGNEALFIKMLIGALAHEMAHPIDYVAKDSLHKRDTSQQLIEVRTDADAARLVRATNLEDDSVIIALTTLGEHDAETGWKKAVIAAASSHPEEQVRLGAQRIYLTVNRFENGDGTLIPLVVDVQSMLAELDRITYLFDPYHLGLKKRWSLEQLITEIEMMFNGKIPNRYKKVIDLRYNFLFTRLIEKLNELEKVSDKDLKRVATLYARYISGKYGNDDDAGFSFYEEGYNEYQKKYIGSERAQVLALKLPLFRTQRFQQMFLTAIEEQVPMSIENAHADKRYKLSEKHIGIFRGLESTGVLRLEESGKALDPYIKAAIKNRIQTKYLNYMWSQIPHMIENFSAEDQIRLSLEYRLQFKKLLSPAERVLAELESVVIRDNIYMFLQPKEDYRHWVHDKESMQNLRAIAEVIWSDRHIHLLAGIISNHGKNNWSMIFSLLGMTEEQGLQELKESFKKFTSSAAYVALLEQLLKMDEKDVKKLKSHDTFRSHRNPLPWADLSLVPFASGEMNPHFKSKELKSFAEQSFGFAMRLKLKEGNVQQEFLAEMNRHFLLEAKNLTAAKVQSIYKQAHLDVKREKTDGLYDQREVTQAIINLPIPAEQKQKILRSLFLNYRPSEKNVVYSGFAFVAWMSDRSPEKTKDVLNLLVKSGTLKSISQFFDEASKVTKEIDKDGSNLIPKEYYNAITILGEELLAEASQISRAEELVEFTRITLDPWRLTRYVRLEASNRRRYIRLIRQKIIAKVAELKPTIQQQRQIFWSLTAAGGTRETDTYLTKIRSTMGEKDLQNCLDNNRLESTKLKVSVLNDLQKTIVYKLKKSFDEKEFVQALEDIKKHVPENSGYKDDCIESLVWSLNIDSIKSLGLAESYKSLNWKTASSNGVKFASFFSEKLKNSSEEVRDALINYFRDPRETDFPKVLDEELLRISKGFSAIIDERQDEVYGEMRSRLESFALDLTREERVPILDNLLHAPGQDPENDVNAQKRIANKFLGFKPGSLNEAGLLAYLRTVPTHERTITLAYILSVSSNEKQSVLPIFEAFQAVGKKIGQFAATWKVFNEEITEELQTLKDRARPLSKLEIIKLLKARLSKEEFNKFKVKRILGTASLKVVVEIELSDGTLGVVAIRFPKAEQVTPSNLKRAKDYLSNVGDEISDGMASLFKQFMGAAGEQLQDEMKFKREVKYMKEAALFFERVNQRLTGNNNWKFNVPGLLPGFKVRDDMFFMQKVTGVPFYELKDPVVRDHVGKMIVEAAVSGLFRDGVFEPDRHRGNILIDEKTKTIHQIDLAQWQTSQVTTDSLQRDERLHLAQLLLALDQGNVGLSLNMALYLSKDGGLNLTPDLQTWMMRAIQNLFSTKKDFEDRLIGLVKIFGDANIPMQKNFLAGHLKGLLVLKAEGYVSAERFREIITRYVAEVLQSKMPLVGQDMAKATADCDLYLK